MMFLETSNVVDYLRGAGRVAPGMPVGVIALSGGVSNVVLRVEPVGADPFVIKQSRERLRTTAPWFSRLERIWVETAAMSVLTPLLPPGSIPRILFEDRENYLFAMEAVDARHVVWKDELLAGRIEDPIAVTLAGYLAAIHGGTHREAAVAQAFDDREIFVQLRVDPFYRHLASVHPELQPRIDALIDEMWQARACLVHADFSPKNVLVVENSAPSRETAGLLDRTLPPSLSPQRVVLIDFETCHYGDPAFDLGFFLSHLWLKAVRAGAECRRLTGLIRLFWRTYLEKLAIPVNDRSFDRANLERRTVGHLAACGWARIDATSPVSYLPETSRRDLVRKLARQMLLEPIESVSDACGLVEGIPWDQSGE